MAKLSKKEKRDIIQWDVKTWVRSLKFWEKHADLSKGKTALAIGEREGGLSLWLAKKGLEVTCTDFRAFPNTTKHLHATYGVEEGMVYDEGVDVTDLSRYQDNQFDIVVFKSVIGVLTHKERQQLALDEIYRILKPGGQLIFAENLKGTHLHVWLRKKFVKWDAYWRYLEYRKDKDLFEKFKVKKFKTTGFLANFGRSEKQRALLAGIDVSISWMIPNSWKYVLIGVLTK